MTKYKFLLFFLVGFVIFGTLEAQDFRPKTSAEIYHDLQKLNFLGNVLYVAAHPDDENTRLISYLNHELHAQTSYMSLTRGDGGQNLIGTEIRELLGVLRTQELLAARNIDGGSQYFSRANDFGFSKNPAETLEIWDEKAVLSDLVKVIRQLRPDVIINRFDHRTPGSTHGHHTSSAILSTQAFHTAAAPSDKKSVSDLEPWQATRQFFNTSWWFYGSASAFEKAQKKDLISLDVGTYYPLLGKSNNEIASLASSQHLCQGFGRRNSRGSEMEYLELLQGEPTVDGSIFSGIDTSWNRIPEGAAISAILEPVSQEFNFKNPAAHLTKLLEAYRLIKNIKDPFWKQQKTRQISHIIEQVAGLHLSFESQQATAAPGDSLLAVVGVLARNSSEVSLTGITISQGEQQIKNNRTIVLQPNKTSETSFEMVLPENAAPSNPYWLNQSPSLGMYQVTDPTLIGRPESPAAITANIKLSIQGQILEYERPLVHRFARPDKGELWEPFTIVPRISVRLSEDVVLFPDQEAKEISVSVTAQSPGQKGNVSVNIPKGWTISPARQEFFLEKKGSTQIFHFQVSAGTEDQEAVVSALATTTKEVHDKELISIAYDHIPTQRVLRPATAKWVRLNIEKQQAKVGYIMGAGDKVPESLAAIGYEVELLEADQIGTTDLSPYKAVILGIRALNVHPEISLQKDKLLNYVQRGGVLISQYNTVSRNSSNEVAIAPYPLKISRDRVTKESAEVKLIDPKHPILQSPNLITSSDFEGWVQERGLYFPDQWDAAYTPLLEMNDPGESPKQGSLLVAPYGRGHFIYTGLSFFRELPAGVPGAYKLFSNLISIPANINTNPIKN